MSIRLYLDEDVLDKDFVQALRSSNMDVVTVTDVGVDGQTDEQQLQYATSQGRVLYSSNMGDFYGLHASYVSQGIPHAGIILVQQKRYSIGEQLRRLSKLMDSRSAEDMKNQAEFLSSWD